MDDTVECLTAVTSDVKLREGPSYCSRHEPNPNLFVRPVSIQFRTNLQKRLNQDIPGGIIILRDMFRDGVDAVPERLHQLKGSTTAQYVRASDPTGLKRVLRNHRGIHQIQSLRCASRILLH